MLLTETCLTPSNKGNSLKDISLKESPTEQSTTHSMTAHHDTPTWLPNSEKPRTSFGHFHCLPPGALTLTTHPATLWKWEGVPSRLYLQRSMALALKSDSCVLGSRLPPFTIARARCLSSSSCAHISKTALVREEELVRCCRAWQGRHLSVVI